MINQQFALLALGQLNQFNKTYKTSLVSSPEQFLMIYI